MGKINLLTSQKLYLQKIFDATLNPSQALNGMVFYNNEGRQVGSLNTVSPPNITLNNGESYNIPTGYHKESGKITAVTLATATADSSALPSEILKGRTAYVQGVKVTGLYEPLDTSDANASTSDILNNKTAYVNGEKITGTYIPLDTSDAINDSSVILAGHVVYGKNDVRLVGTMPNNTSINSNGNVPGINDSYPNVPTREGNNLQYNIDTEGTARISLCPPPGYYQGYGASYVNRPAADFGNATVDKVLEGNYFTSGSGLGILGTLPNRGLMGMSPISYLYHNTDDKTYLVNWIKGGYYKGWQVLEGDTDKYAEAWIEQSQVANAIGLTSDKLAYGSTVLGISGTSRGLPNMREIASSSSSSGATVSIDSVDNYILARVYSSSSYNASYFSGILIISKSDLLNGKYAIYSHSRTSSDTYVLPDLEIKYNSSNRLVVFSQLKDSAFIAYTTNDISSLY